MEHRWGERVGVDLPVRVTTHPFTVRHARIVNLSVSGASLAADFELRPLSRIQLVIEIASRARCEAPSIVAYVARCSKTTIGIEWCEFAPEYVSDLLSSIATRPYGRLRRPDPALTPIFSKLSAPLLKHGI